MVDLDQGLVQLKKTSTEVLTIIVILSPRRVKDRQRCGGQEQAGQRRKSHSLLEAVKRARNTKVPGLFSLFHKAILLPDVVCHIAAVLLNFLACRPKAAIV